MDRMYAITLMSGALMALLLLLPTTAVQADVYSTFKTTRYYSSNRRFFVEVTPKKRATLYRNGRQLRRVWTRSLPFLPSELLVTSDGSRIVLIDHYYGNKNHPAVPVVVFLNESGSEVASSKLSEVSNLSRAVVTTSTTHWYRNSQFTADERFLIIETVTANCDPAALVQITSAEEADACWKLIPYEQLSFATLNGKLISRKNIR